MTKECPLCGERMQLHPVVHTERIPGTSQSLSRESREWRCPECDYFEEPDGDDLATAP